MITISDSQSTVVLVAFDGSAEAQRALVHAAKLFPQALLQIVTAYEPLTHQAMRAVGAPGVAMVDLHGEIAEADTNYQQAVACGQQAVAVAAELGVECGAHVVESPQSTWSAIVDAAHALQADVIVTGTRLSSGGLKGLLSSSTSENVLHNAGMPVLIVPPADHSPR
ncbi:universal stress protein [Corynebacterium choanae]|uniref:universal stress protein n=1 Tax=Corynebacterium choanae TaxID=1862358 RepID=UPI001FE35AB8|nr:universal stress protein [Corynebacterium choanae]